MPFTHFKFSSTWCGQRMKRDSNQGLWTFCILIHLTLKRPLAPKLKQSHGRNSNWWLPHCLPSTRSTIQFIQSFDYVSLRQYSVTFDCNVQTRSLDHKKISPIQFFKLPLTDAFNIKDPRQSIFFSVVFLAIEYNGVGKQSTSDSFLFNFTKIFLLAGFTFAWAVPATWVC